MPGIDLIDLKDPLLHKRDKGAIRLILHPEDKYPHDENEFWYLWTAKEAIFKAQRDLTNFNPKDIKVVIQKNGEQLSFTSGEIKGKLLKQGDMILALADTRLDQISYEVVERQTNDDSSEVRGEVVKHFKNKYDLDVKVKSDGDGLPILDYKNIPLSLTHHARYMAFAYHSFE